MILRKILTPAIVCLITCSGLLAQRGPTDFGSVTVQDLLSNTNEPAVVLFDKAEFLYPNFKRHIRIKINKKDAFGDWSDFKVDNSYGAIFGIKAMTYFMEGGKLVAVPVESSDILSDRKHTNEKVVSMVSVRENCIVELSYKTTFQGAIPFWTIQRDVPVLWSEFGMSAPFPLTCFIRGNISVDVMELKHHNRWVFKNVPAHKLEPNMPPDFEHYARLEFGDDPSTWAEINKFMNKAYSIRHQKFPSRAVRNKTEELILGIPDPLSKAKVVHKFVRDNFTWNDDATYLPGDASEVFQAKRGTSGEINEVLFNMLEFAGLFPQPVLLRTRNVGPMDKSLATLDQFNYMVCSLTLDGKRYFLDATETNLPFEALPLICLNTTGFLVEESGFQWIEISQTVPAKTSITATLSIDDNHALTGKIAVLSTGYDAFAKAAQQILKPESPLTDFIQSNNVVLDTIYQEFPGEVNTRFIEIYHATIPSNVVESGNKLFISPFFVVDEYETTFNSTTRQLPIDFFLASELSCVVRITVPKDYKVEAIPEDKRFLMPDKSISFSFKSTHNNSLVVTTSHFSNPRTYFLPAEYKQLRELYQLSIVRQSEQIIFSK